VKTVDFLAERGGIPAYANGTLTDIQAKADEANVTLSISLPVLTRPESFDSILSFAKAVNEGRERGEHPCNQRQRGDQTADFTKRIHAMSPFGCDRSL
jgi:hypothetical protein